MKRGVRESVTEEQTMTGRSRLPAAPAVADASHLADPSGPSIAGVGVAPPGAVRAAGQSAAAPPRRGRRNWGDYIFAAPYLMLFGLFLIYPLATGLGLSFMNYDLVSPEKPQFGGVANYADALRDGDFWRAMRASTVFVLLCAPLTVVIALVLAAMIDSVRGVRQHVYRVAVFVPTVLTVSVAGLLWRWFYNTDFGPINALLVGAGLGRVPWLGTPTTAMLSLVAMTLWWTIGGPVLILLAGLQNIPAGYYEAGAIDGATGPRAFWSITLPLLRPALLFVGVLNIIGGFQVFGQVYIITSGGPSLSTRTAVQYIYDTAFGGYRLGYGAAMSWLLFLAIAFFSAVQFRLARDRD